jgi:hypothetical protein
MFARANYNLPSEFFWKTLNALEDENFARDSTGNCVETTL